MNSFQGISFELQQRSNVNILEIYFPKIELVYFWKANLVRKSATTHEWNVQGSPGLKVAVMLTKPPFAPDLQCLRLNSFLCNNA